jgi:hypothetical protein
MPVIYCPLLCVLCVLCGCLPPSPSGAQDSVVPRTPASPDISSPRVGRYRRGVASSSAVRSTGRRLRNPTTTHPRAHPPATGRSANRTNPSTLPVQGAFTKSTTTIQPTDATRATRIQGRDRTFLPARPRCSRPRPSPRFSSLGRRKRAPSATASTRISVTLGNIVPPVRLALSGFVSTRPTLCRSKDRRSRLALAPSLPAVRLASAAVGRRRARARVPGLCRVCRRSVPIACFVPRFCGTLPVGRATDWIPREGTEP